MKDRKNATWMTRVLLPSHERMLPNNNYNHGVLPKFYLLKAMFAQIESNSPSAISCLVGILVNTPGGVKRSGLGAHAVGLLVVY